MPQPPSTALPGSLRNNLRKAKDLLAAAGWTYRDGALRNARGEPLTIEFLDNSSRSGPVNSPFIQALGKLGIAAEVRIVDFALLQKRMDVFDFDLFVVRVPGSEAPGNELLDRFGSKSADTEGSSNLIGVKDPAVDVLLGQVVSSRTRPELVARLRALDRILRHGHYAIAQYYSNTYRIAYRSGKFEQPAVMPLYYQAESWVLETWWKKR